MQYLTMLEKMTIVYSMEVDLSNFGDAIECQGLKSLQSLEIKSCPNLISLLEGMGGLTSLQTLGIWNCDKLISLPEGIQGLNLFEHTTNLWLSHLTEKMQKRNKRRLAQDCSYTKLERNLSQQQTN